MPFTKLDEGSPHAVPEVCTTIEEVGSTGVGALTVAFLVLAITTIIFVARSAVPGGCQNLEAMGLHECNAEEGFGLPLKRVANVR